MIFIKYSLVELYGNNRYNKLKSEVHTVMGTVIDTYSYTIGPKTSFLISFGPMVI